MLITSDRQREKERATTIHNIYNTVHKEKTKMEEKFKVVFVPPPYF
jgi:16S rRNA G966 N2-methylase RsmD